MKKINKLYVLTIISCNKIIALTEEKYHIKLFILQNNYSNKDYNLKILSDIKTINKYLIKYDDLYLIEYKNFIIREIDKYIISELLYKYEKEVYSMMDTLNNINNNCIMDYKEHRLISDCLDMLSKKMDKKKSKDEFLNTNQIIRDYFNDYNIRNELEEIYYKYDYNINK